MTQPVNYNKGGKIVVAKKVKTKSKRPTTLTKKIPYTRHIRFHKEYGTSKLEERFAKDFLDVLGVKYIYQFKAESIGRYFDFYLPKENLILEVDGDYW